MNTIFDKIFENINLRKIAIIDNNIEYTYEDLFNDSNLLNEYFKKNFGTNKKLCISLSNCYISVLIFFISSTLNFKIFPINSNFSVKNINSYNKKYDFDIYIGENNIIKNNFKKNQYLPEFISKEKIKKILN